MTRNTDSESGASILVAVMHEKYDVLLKEAVSLAKATGLPLVCSHVEPNRYIMTNSFDGSVITVPDEAGFDDETVVFDEELAALIHEFLEGRNIEYRLQPVSGDPARALARVAQRISARYIVVGTREPGVRGGLRELINGSVAAYLAHRQQIPLVVVPLYPVAGHHSLPWENEEQ